MRSANVWDMTDVFKQATQVFRMPSQVRGDHDDMHKFCFVHGHRHIFIQVSTLYKLPIIVHYIVLNFPNQRRILFNNF